MGILIIRIRYAELAIWGDILLFYQLPQVEIQEILLLEEFQPILTLSKGIARTCETS